MTNHWIDIKNSDCIMIMGSNAAENHPVSFRYVTQAMQNGAKLISVDPRFTRTSSKADIYAPIRSGTDIAFLGGMIKYILDNDLADKAYVTSYTNASFLVNKAFTFENGLFSGYRKNDSGPVAGSYDKKAWAYQQDANGAPERDRSLQDPSCVFQLLKKHYQRYDTATVSKITGTPEAALKKIYETYAATGATGRAGTILYAMGWTQHTHGTQNIRAMAMIQLLLGNMGVAGGGVNALRGESNVQGSTDHCLLWHIWPGYLAVPSTKWPKLADYLARRAESKDPLSANWWQNEPKYMVSILKSFFGDAATTENDFGYDWVPKVDAGTDYSWLDIFDAMYDGEIKGFFAWGQNPACSGANANKVRQSLKNLDWMVNVNIFDNETGSFWKGPGMDPKTVNTEVFFLPAAVSVEKEGSITNSGRWMQWRYRGPNPLGESRPDGEIIIELGKRLKDLYARGGTFPEPIKALRWDYTTGGRYDPHKVAKAVNGYFLQDVTVKGKSFKKGTLVPSFAYLQADGTTSSGNWLYCNSYTEKGNMAARRGQQDAVNGIGLYPAFAWCWPLNRRILYNRASVDPKGNPWDKDQWVVRWNGKNWEGDVPDGGWPPLEDMDNPNPKSRYPFIMLTHGLGQIFGPGRKDGPFPEHYEPLECPVENNLLNPRRVSPTAAVFSGKADSWSSCDPRFPFVATTYRVSEHWQTGLLTRHQPWLMELQPQVFVEMSEELAKLKGIAGGERVRVYNQRGSLEATAVVTQRFKPFRIAGHTVHQVGLPWCFGWHWPRTSVEESANLLTPSAGDPNTRIPETKAFMVNVAKL